MYGAIVHVYYTCMKKLTITVDDAVYEGLYRKIGRRRISRFLEALPFGISTSASSARPHVIEADLEKAYAAMAEDEAREAQALEWSENLIDDLADESR